MDAIKPNYYKFTILGIEVDLFQIGESLGLNNRLFSALKYITRNKVSKVEDLRKAIRCIELEIEDIERV